MLDFDLDLENDESDGNDRPATKTVVVLGAGASRGSSLVSGDLQPPLVRDFFDCGNKLGILAKEDFRPLWSYLETEGGISFSKILELESKGFINIEHIYSLISQLDDKGDMERLLERFVYEVLTATTQVYKDKTCHFHDLLLEKLKPDVIISFNYDLIIDKSMASVYPGWETDHIAEFAMVFNGEKFVKTDEYLSEYKENQEISAQYPQLFKLHGSLNHYYDVTFFERTRARTRWDKIRTDYIVPLKYAFDTPRVYQSRPLRDYAPSTIQSSPEEWAYDRQRAELKLDLIPPIWNKERSDWDHIIEELRQAAKIVFVGYSMADIDLWVLHMFRLGYMKHMEKKNMKIEVVNRNPDVVKRIQSIYFESEVENKAKSLKEYAQRL